MGDGTPNQARHPREERIHLRPSKNQWRGAFFEIVVQLRLQSAQNSARIWPRRLHVMGCANFRHRAGSQAQTSSSPEATAASADLGILDRAPWRKK